MNYKFPEIRTIDDVLPHIEGSKEFIVAERDGFTVINYQVSMPDTFPPIKVAGGSAKQRAERAFTNAMRRECRGIIFYLDGKIMSRPFHKFFNVNEREETLSKNVVLDQEHVIMEKMDGSMIRPMLVNGKIRLGTKMGITDVSAQAENCLMNISGFSPAEWDVAQRSPTPRIKHLEWLRAMMLQNVTPLFEFIAPNNQIVINYEKSDLVLLAIRNNLTGEYLDIETMRDNGCFTVVDVYGSVDGNLDEYIERARQREDREGDIIRFADGHMLKIKNDWYVRIHKTLDQIRFDRNIVDLIINNNVDDVLPMLPENEANKVKLFEAEFWSAYNTKKDYLEKALKEIFTKGKQDRKLIATKVLPKYKDRALGQYVFGVLDGKLVEDMLMDSIKKNIGTNSKWETFGEWFYV